MALVLAIESDPHQAGLLERIVREGVPADLVVSDSKDSAIASIAERLPDLILVSALMSPREEAELTEHLRGLEDADHLQTLTIPLLASKPARRPARGRMLRALKWRRAQALEGCDPSVFAEEIRGYLERARELRAQRRLERDAEEEVQDVRTEETAATGLAAESIVLEQPPIVPLAGSVDVREPMVEAAGGSSAVPALETPETPEPVTPGPEGFAAEHDHVSLVIEPPPIRVATLDEVAIARPEEPERAEPQSPPEPVPPLPPAAAASSESLRRHDYNWIAGAIDALRLDSQRSRVERTARPLAPPAAPTCAPPPVERVPVERPAAPPDTASSGERVLRLVKTERRRARKEKPSPSAETPASRARRRPAEAVPPPPIEDEWGIHDPRECGFDALMARLDAPTATDPPAPSSEGRHVRGFKKEIASPAVLQQSGERRVTPLAIWAHAEADAPETDAGRDDLRGLFASLALPAGIASVSFPTGCRIRRIRVAPSAGRESAITRERRTIILSRRLLRELQQRDALRAETPNHLVRRQPSTLAGTGP